MRSALIMMIGVFLWSGMQAQTPAADSLQTQIQLRTFLEQEEVPLNREVVYQVELSWQGQLNRYHIQKIGEPTVSNLKLRGSGSSNRFFVDSTEQPRSLKRITYYFTPQEIGMAYIDGVTIQYEDTKLNQHESLLSQRVGVKIAEPLPEPGQGMSLGQIVVLALVFLFLITLAYFIWRYFKIRKEEQQAEDETAGVSLEDNYLSELKNTVQLNSGSADRQFEALSAILFRYLKERFQLSGAALSAEIEQKIQKYLPGDEIGVKLKTMLERSELSKFARESVSETELHMFYDTTELFLQKMQDITVE